MDFDPLSPEMLEDPYPTYARMRREEPAHSSEKFPLAITFRPGPRRG